MCHCVHQALLKIHTTGIAVLNAQDIARKVRLVVFSARCNIYISHLCYDVSVHLSVRLVVTEVHWCIIANLGFKFRSQFATHCGRGACGREGRDHRQEEWRDHLALCQPLLGALVLCIKFLAVLLKQLAYFTKVAVIISA